MIALRLAALATAAIVAVAAFGATGLQPSATRLAITAIVGLLAPLFWPGAGATAVRTGMRIVAWALAAACVAAITLRFAGNGQTLARILPASAMLLLILIVTNAAATTLERRSLGRPGNARCSPEMAGCIVTLALALLGALPLWLGPAAELLSAREPWIVDAVIAASPLTHLAVASGNDLLRNPWFYQHANLAAVQFSYPGVTEIALLYGAVASMLALVSFAHWKPSRAAGRASSVHPLKEPAS